MAWTTHRDLRNGGWTPESPNSAPVRLPELGPTGDSWWRFTLNDGETGAGSGIPSERRDCVFGGAQRGRKYNLRGFIRFPEGIPTISQDRWTMAGWELHGENRPELSQALIMLEVDIQKRYRLNANAGRSTPRYSTITRDAQGNPTPIVPARTYAMEMEFVLTERDDIGYVRVWLDGVLVSELLGRTVLAAYDGAYFKEALYRNSANNGRLTKDWTGVTARVGDVADTREALGPWPPEGAPPPTGDTTAPQITLSMSNEAVARLDLPDADTARVLLGVAGTAPEDPFPPIELTGDEIDPITFVQFPREALEPGVQRWAWAQAWDEAGNTRATPGVPFTPTGTPPPPPTDECAEQLAAERLRIGQAHAKAAELVQILD